MADHDGQRRGLSRRGALAGAAGLGATLSTGCVQRVQSLVSRRQPERLTLSIKVVPADTDPVATRIARRLSTRLESVGVGVDLSPMAPGELRRDVLVDHDFDVYVGRYPGHEDPDFLHSLLHSVHLNDVGWLNPFGYTDLEVDDLLVDQRTLSGQPREVAVADVQRQIARQQPFSVIAVPDDIATARSDRYEGFGAYGPSTPLRYLGLERTGTEPTLGLALTDGSVTRNLNPIAVAEGDRRAITGLLYDPLGRRVDGRVWPWLASEWHFEHGDDRTHATISLREGTTWHDGTPLTAEDVAFTYRFLRDTSLGRRESPVPAPPYQGHVSPVEAVEQVDERSVRLTFADANLDVCRRAFTVPVLPAHVWSEKTGPARFAGVDVLDGTVEALIWPNMDPVGSGPLRFGSVTRGSSLTLERFDGHFLASASGEITDRFGDGAAFDTLEIQVTPSDAAAVELAAAGDVDATAGTLTPAVVPQVGRTPDLQLYIHRSRGFYHVGYNVRRAPFGNPHFRRVMARLLDKERIVTDLLEGYGVPAASPLAGTQWVPPGLTWAGEDPEVPFFGSEGTLDTETVKDALRDAGYEFGPEGRLLAR